ncbi:MAG: hypothetical protein ACTTIC_08365 [Helicobacteraceae bacterium]
MIAFYAVFVAAVLAISWFRPSFDWDMLGYAASALHFENSDTAAIHKTVYETLEGAVNQSTYDYLTNANQYRKEMLSSADWFAQQLPYYEIRLIYNALVYLLYKLGVNVVIAPFYVSGLAVAFGLIALFFAGLNRLDDRLIFLVPLAFWLFNGFYVARNSSPDSLGFAFMMLFLYLFVRGKLRSLLFLMPVLVLVRTDFVIFSVLFLAFLTYKDPLNRRGALVSLAATLGVYFAINKITGNYGWATIFYVSFIDRVPNPADLNLSVSVEQYLYGLTQGLKNTLKDGIFALHALLFGLNLALLRKLGVANARLAATIVFTVFTYMACHFILFPAMWFRLMMSFYMLNFLATLLMLHQLIAQGKSAQSA